MKLAQSVIIGAWILVGLNLLMAFGSIWVFMRMAPAIETIIDRNERSLKACEEMLSFLTLMTGDRAENERLETLFKAALTRAQANITETDEPVALHSIADRYQLAFQGNEAARQNTVAGIVHLGEINRKAMIKADQKARQFGSAGAWGVVFMALAVFFVGLVFMGSLTRNLVKPLEEIYGVLTAYEAGDPLRRCSGAELPKDIRRIYTGMNELLDKGRFQKFH